MEQFNANPIRSGVGLTVTPPQTASRSITPTESHKPDPQNLILTPNVSSEPRGHPELGTSSHSSSSEVLVVLDEPSAVVSSNDATISQVYESYIDDFGDHRYRVVQQHEHVVQGKKVENEAISGNVVQVEYRPTVSDSEAIGGNVVQGVASRSTASGDMATKLYDDVVQVIASRPTASDNVISVYPVPSIAADVMPAPGGTLYSDTGVLSSQAVASYVFSGGARNYLTASDAKNEADDELTLNSALEFLASRESVAANDGVNVMTADNVACEVASVGASQPVGSAAVPAIITQSSIASACISDLPVAGMDVGAGHRPFEQVDMNVMRSTASRTAFTAVPVPNISLHDIDVAIERYDVPDAMMDDCDKRFITSDNRNAHSTAINDAINSREMHYTAMNAPIVSSTAATNAAMAEIGRFSRSYSNNDRMQSGGEVYMSDVCSARMHEVDTFDLTGLFCRAQARAQQAQRSQQLYTLVDEDYPSAGQRPPDSPPQPTQQTQASTTQQTYASQQLQPTQQVDLFQQELMAMADAAMQQRHAVPASPALALTDVHLAVPPPATAEASHLALTSTPVAAHYSAPRQLDTTVPMQPGQRCGPHLPRSKRPASDDSYIELDSTVSIRRRLQHYSATTCYTAD